MIRRLLAASPLNIFLVVVLIAVFSTILGWQPSDHGEPLSALAGTPATIFNISAQATPATLIDYLKKRKTEAGPFATPSAIYYGRFVSFEVQNLPQQSERCEIHWTQTTSAMEHLEPGFWRYSDVLGWPDGLLFPEFMTPRYAGEVWVPDPRTRPGEYMIQLTLRCEGEDEDVASANTLVFRIEATPGPGGATPNPLQQRKPLHSAQVATPISTDQMARQGINDEPTVEAMG